MNRAVIGLTATVLIFFAGVGIFALRHEPPAGPLLAIAPPADDSAASSLPEFATKRNSDIAGGVVFAAESDATDSAASSPISDERREEVRQLIRRLKPNQPESTIDVWVDEFCQMTDEDISFLIMQSGMLSGISEGSLLAAPNEEHVANAFGLGPDRQGMQSSAQQQARRNLENVRTIGYRESVEVTAVPPDETSRAEQIALHRLNCGDVVVTGNPLHFALRTPGAVFFQLEDGRLTRNGMFTAVTSGEIGLAGTGEPTVLRNSPVLPSDHSWRIAEDGQVFVDGNDGAIGRIRIVRVMRPQQLTSADGVYFRTESEVMAVEDVQLETGALELSNVDLLQNQQLLN